MSSLGNAPILDFDGTLAHLRVDWQALRDELGVRRIDDLWQRTGERHWEVVHRAEVRGAELAEPRTAIINALAGAATFAVLTSNAEASVARFLDRFPDLAERARLVVGRTALAGPKTDFDVFARGFEQCVRATAAERGNAEIVYVGDMQYELEFARRLGAKVIDVADYG